MNLNEKKMKLISWVVLSSALFLSSFFHGKWEANHGDIGVLLKF
ncbi:hypothetical protein LEP1GSC150_2744 [Leptospira interrogans serovar Copenhageni str. LT2050]|uniref:Uncharacterized protein n=1 Tax=Leptospira interrogans serovar Copenhageni str. LT2050 TaxID=1001598 RepID=M3IUX1_LEPIT|nr:hypothetical protein LEP1GSC150_2744 [Leptospira interrogans serovar Copenhageni str. LT2050]